MSILEAILLGFIEGVTEFLPVSSTGHLTVAESLTGYDISGADITAFTAIVQVGAIAAALVFFWGELWGILTALVGGVTDRERRDTRDFRFGVAVAVGSIPIAIAGLAFKDLIEGDLRNLWIVAFALIGWSFVMYSADQAATERRHEDDFNLRDALVMGLTQCIALIPGISRSGATIAAGLFRDLDRVTVTRMSFFLAIPALTAAGALEAVTKADEISAGVGWGPTVVSMVVAFFVAYASISWLLRYVSGHNFAIFILYRIALGLILIAFLATGVVSAT
jgi:undecaprenyl-diphosphatase